MSPQDQSVGLTSSEATSAESPLRTTESSSLENSAGLIEIGWLVCDNLDEVDRDAIAAASELIVSYLRQQLGDFDWRVRLEVRETPVESSEREPAEYFDWAITQRDLRGWDYVFVFMKPDLESRQRAHAWAGISRSLDSAIISTARIDPRADDCNATSQTRSEVLAQRLSVLVLRAIGHLAGLDRVEDTGNFMGDFGDVTDLDRAIRFDAAQLDVIRKNAHRIADLRLEEEPLSTAAWWSFYPRAVWRNRVEILDSVRQAKPWQMPFRLTRLTIAAVSTVLVLTMTAEAWELGSRQSAASVLALSVVAIIATIVYVMLRQRLLLRRGRSRLSEQVVTTNVTTVAIVGGGMLVTYGCLFVLTLTISLTLFDGQIIGSWTQQRLAQLHWTDYPIFAGFVAAAGIIIGSMGASFEGQNYFRHITFVDYEV